MDEMSGEATRAQTLYSGALTPKQAQPAPIAAVIREQIKSYEAEIARLQELLSLLEQLPQLQRAIDLMNQTRIGGRLL